MRKNSVSHDVAKFAGARGFGNEPARAGKKPVA
jgi:hypothetical protein